MNAQAQNWREIGDTTLDVYKQEFAKVNSPLLASVEEVYNAARPHSALCLAHMKIENQYSTTGILITQDMHNPLSLRPRYGETDRSGFAVFATYTDCMNAWKRRFDDPQLGYKDTTTLDQYIAIYAPSGDIHPVTGVDNADMGYAQSIRELLMRYASLEGDTMATPTIIDKWLHVAQDGYAAVNRRYIGRFGMAPKIIVLHIQEGNNWGSWQHFHVVTASATVLIGKNGDIWRLVPESDSPWTNGDVAAPTALGWEIINQWGADPNVYSLTIETEGFTGEWPKPQAQLDAVVWQIRTWMAKYNIPLKYVVRHADLNSVSRPYCPGNAFFDYVKKKLAEGTVTPAPVYAERDYIIDPATNKQWDGTKDLTLTRADGTTKVFHAEIREVTGVKGGQVRRYATTTSPITRAPLGDKEVFNVLGWVDGQEVNGEKRWWITKSHSRVHVSGSVEKPKAIPSAPADAADELPGGAKIVDGSVYYPALEDGKPRELEVKVKGAILRKAANTTSEEVGRVHMGDKITVAYWTFGSAVAKERVWWVLDTPNKDPITEGARLWVAATTERPA